MDYIQAVIARLANNSFVMKGWALTLCSALLGFAVSRAQGSLALVSLVPAVAFWVLDAYYLRQERAFRSMFRKVAAEDIEEFDMNPAPYAKNEEWRKAVLSFSIAAFYGLIIAVSCLVLIAVSAEPGAFWVRTSEAAPPSASGSPASSEIPGPR